jgi:hypothetical protein
MPQIDLGAVEIVVFEPDVSPVMTSQDPLENPESVLIREEESDASR